MPTIVDTIATKIVAPEQTDPQNPILDPEADHAIVARPNAVN